MEHITSATGGGEVTADRGSTADRSVAVRYWAGAAEAAGVRDERLAVSGHVMSARDDAAAVTGADVRQAIRQAHPGIDAVLSRCSLLHDGRRLRDDDPVKPAVLVEVLPPFVGG